MVKECPTCKTTDAVLNVGDFITIIDGDGVWKGKTGKIEFFRVPPNGIVRMGFASEYGRLKGCTIEKLCPKCMKPVHTLTFE